MAAEQRDPLEKVANELRGAWREKACRVVWPLTVQWQSLAFLPRGLLSAAWRRANSVNGTAGDPMTLVSSGTSARPRFGGDLDAITDLEVAGETADPPLQRNHRVRSSRRSTVTRASNAYRPSRCARSAPGYRSWSPLSPFPARRDRFAMPAPISSSPRSDDPDLRDLVMLAAVGGESVPSDPMTTPRE